MEYTRYNLCLSRNSSKETTYILDIKPSLNPVDKKLNSIAHDNILILDERISKISENQFTASLTIPKNNSDIEKSIQLISNAIWNLDSHNDECISLIFDSIDKKSTSSENTALCLKQKKFNQLQNNSEIFSFLKNSTDIIIEVTFKNYNYKIKSIDLLQDSLLSDFFLSSFNKSLKLLYGKGKQKIRLNLDQFFSSIGEQDCILSASFIFTLKALEVVNKKEINLWPISALILAYLGADYLCYNTIKEDLFLLICQKFIVEDSYQSITPNYIKSLNTNLQGFTKSLVTLPYFIQKCMERFYSVINGIRDEMRLEQKAVNTKKINIEQLEAFTRRSGIKELYTLGYRLNLEKFISSNTSVTINGFTIYKDAFTTHSDKDIIKKIENFLFDFEIKDELINIFFKKSNFDFIQNNQINFTNNQSKTFLSISLEKWICFAGRCLAKDPSKFQLFLTTHSRNVLRSIVLEAVKNNPSVLQYADGEMKDDFEIAMAAVKKNGLLLQYLSQRLKKTREIVLEAVKNNPYAIEFAGQEMKDNFEIAMAAVKKDGYFLRHLSLRLKNNREIVLEAVKNQPFAIQYAGEEMKDNFEIAMAAVKKDGSLLQYLSLRLKNTQEIVLEAVKNDPSAIQYAEEELKDDFEIAMAAVKNGGYWLPDFSLRLRNTREIVLEAVKNDPFIIQYAGKEMKDNFDIAMAAVKKNGSSLDYFSLRLRNTREIVLEAIKNKPFAIEYAGEEMKDNFDIAMTAVKKDGSLLRYLSLRLKNTRQIVLEAFKNNPSAIQYAGEEMKDNFEIAMTAVKRDGSLLQYLSLRLQNTREIVLEAVKNDPSAIQYAGDKLQYDIKGTPIDETHNFLPKPMNSRSTIKKFFSNIFSVIKNIFSFFRRIFVHK